VRLHHDHCYRVHNIDALFTSLAASAGKRTIGVLLYGMLNDGSLGFKAIEDAGGLAFVQSAAEAGVPAMPQNAIKYGGEINRVAPSKNAGQGNLPHGRPSAFSCLAKTAYLVKPARLDRENHVAWSTSGRGVGCAGSTRGTIP